MDIASLFAMHESPLEPGLGGAGLH